MAAKIQESEAQRKHIMQEFQKTLNKVSTIITESNTQNSKLGEENRQMAERLSLIYEEFKGRENEVDRISKQIEIERQLGEARCSKLTTEFLIEKHQLSMENDTLNGQIQRLTQELVDSTAKCTQLERQSADLTAQLNKYTEKYEEFESTITRSGTLFDHVKGELSKMTKQVKTLEREEIEWQTRYHKSINANYELQLEINELKKIIEDSKKKQLQLTKLCRQIQLERKAYLTTLRELGKSPSEIYVETADDVIEEITKEDQVVVPPVAQLDESRLGAKHKVSTKSKRDNKKSKKAKESVETVVPLTPKEIQLAELKLELARVEQLMKNEKEAIKNANEKKEENVGKTSPVRLEDVSQPGIVIKADDAKVQDLVEATGFIPITKEEGTELNAEIEGKGDVSSGSDIIVDEACISSEIIVHQDEARLQGAVETLPVIPVENGVYESPQADSTEVTDEDACMAPEKLQQQSDNEALDDTKNDI